MSLILSQIGAITFVKIIIGIAAPLIISVVSYRINILTKSGAIATFILAGIIFNLGEIKWSIPILTFFILSSMLSKLRKKKNEEVELYFEKSGVRDCSQVLANGGIGGALVIINSIFPNQIFYMFFLSSLSAVCADTWATEIGTLKKSSTYNIIDLKPVEQGMSGGISLIGTCGAFMGAVTISISGFYWNEIHSGNYFILIISTGIIGCFFDSFLGATLQVQNRCNVCNKITERENHCGRQTEFHKGLKWMNNNAVNFLSGISAMLVLLILTNFIK